MKAIKSFSRLMNSDIKMARELKLEVKSMVANTSFSTLAKSSPITYHAEDQLRLLNDSFPKGIRKLGDLIKVVR